MSPPAPQGYSAGIWGYTKKVCPGPLALLLIAIFVSLVFRYTYEKEIAVEAKRNSTDRKCCSTGKFNNLIGATAWHVLGSVHDVRAEVSDGTCGSINKLQHPLLLAAANPFCRTPLNNLWELLEFHRNVGHLVYLDTLDAVSAWKSHGVFMVFFCCQWLSWSHSGPDARQPRASPCRAGIVLLQPRHQKLAQHD